MNTRRAATFSGFLALVFWATNTALTRSLVEPLGPFTTLALSYGGGGLLLLLVEALRGRGIPAMLRLPRSYLFGCGFLYIAYCLLYVIAHSLAPSREITLQLNVVNYLWPAMTILFSILVFHYPTRWLLLVAGLVLGVLGVTLAAVHDLSFSALVANFSANRRAFTYMFLAALSWGLYSNLARKFSSDSAATGVPFFQLAIAIFCLAARFLTGETSSWNPRLTLELAYLIALPTAFSSLFWEVGARRGDLVLLGAVSFLTPLGSTLFAAWYLEQPLHPNVLIGCLLVVAAAVLCRISTRE